MTVTKPYAEIAAAKVAQRDSNFVQDWLLKPHQLPHKEDYDVTKWISTTHHLSHREIEITETDAKEILSNIRKQNWTSYEVTSAFCHRASIAHQLVNCLSEVFFKVALQRAKELDEYQERNNDVVGPLHGLPISLKDNFNIKGQASTLGLVNWCFIPDKFETDAVLVEQLKRLGAILYVKTNVPVAMMMPETTNNIYGYTKNPLNVKLSSGGSSGGEAALLALKGSRHCLGRFPTYGCRSGLPGLESVSSINGPLSTSLPSLEFYCKTIISDEPWNYDPKAIPLTWRKVDLPKSLNIGYILDDGYVRPTPPIRRGLKIALDALEKGGHELISFEPVEHLRLSELILDFFTSEGGKNILEQTNATGETLFPYMKNYGTTPEKGTAEVWALQSERTQLAKSYLDRWLQTSKKTRNGKPIDAIIIPASPFAAAPINKFPSYVGYTSPFNALDFSVGIFPVTRADKDLDKEVIPCANYSDIDREVFDTYDPEEIHGGAVALQLVGRRLEEEKVIAMLKVVSEAITKNTKS